MALEEEGVDLSTLKEEELTKQLFKNLKRFRYDWSDEIPETVVHSSDSEDKEKIKYKIRTTWFTIVSSTLEVLNDQGALSNPKQQEALQHFLAEFTKNNEFHRKKLNTIEDVKKANQLIDMVLDNNEKV